MNSYAAIHLENNSVLNINSLDVYISTAGFAPFEIISASRLNMTGSSFGNSRIVENAFRCFYFTGAGVSTFTNMDIILKNCQVNALDIGTSDIYMIGKSDGINKIVFSTLNNYVMRVMDSSFNGRVQTSTAGSKSEINLYPGSLWNMESNSVLSSLNINDSMADIRSKNSGAYNVGSVNDLSSNNGTIVLNDELGETGMSFDFGKEFIAEIDNSSNLVLEPKAELSYIYAEGDRMKTNSSKEIEFTNSHSLNLKAGLTLGYVKAVHSEMVIKPYLEIGYEHEFLGKTDIIFDGHKRTADISGGYADFGGGVDAYLGKGWSLYTNLIFEKGAYHENIGINAGIRMGF